MPVTGIAYQPFVGLTGSDELQQVWEALEKEVSEYLDTDAQKELLRAAIYGANAHEGQMRQSGEPYFTHPIEVARILAEQQFDLLVLQAGLLHDVLEDTSVSKTDMAKAFGAEVTAIVDGVSKLERLKDQAPQEALAISFHKMLIATIDDPRVIIIKLADRLHNMQTLGALRPDKRIRKARETLDFYASIAGKLGLFYFRIQLEDLAFSHLHPWRYAVLKRHYNARYVSNDVLNKIRRDLAPEFAKLGIFATIEKRRRHLWDVYLRMKRKKNFKDACRTVPLRIITETADDCYRVLGVVHARYRPISGKFEDYIAAPKSNGYHSLHTSVLMSKRNALNVQIRTLEMNTIAETGIIAVFHQKLKNQSINLDKHTEVAEKSVRDWLSRLREMQDITDDPLEFYDTVKKELNQGGVHIYTPTGEVIDLPKGATAVDFAYAIHRGVGNHCMGAKVNGAPYPIFRPLKTAQTVEIITDDNAHPHAGWLQFVVTAKARTGVRQYLRNLEQNEAEHLGKQLFEQALREFRTSFELLPEQKLNDYLNKNQLRLNKLFSDIAFGQKQAGLVAATILGKGEFEFGQDQILYVHSAFDSGILLAECCHPLYDDKLIGHIILGKGIQVHRKKCSVVQVTDGQDWLRVQWAEDVHGVFVALLGLDVENRPRMLSAITEVIAACGSNIADFQMQRLARKEDVRRLKIWLEVHHRDQLAQVIRRLRLIDGIERIERV